MSKENYKPHITVRNDNHIRVGDKVIINSLSIIEKEPGGNANMRRIAATIRQESRHYPVVGRKPGINFDKYLVRVHGRDIIDYDRLKQDDPALYQQILEEEEECRM